MVPRTIREVSTPRVVCTGPIELSGSSNASAVVKKDQNRRKWGTDLHVMEYFDNTVVHTVGVATEIEQQTICCCCLAILAKYCTVGATLLSRSRDFHVLPHRSAMYSTYDQLLFESPFLETLKLVMASNDVRLLSGQQCEVTRQGGEHMHAMLHPATQRGQTDPPPAQRDETS